MGDPSSRPGQSRKKGKQNVRLWVMLGPVSPAWCGGIAINLKSNIHKSMKKLLATVCALALSSIAVFAGEYPDISIAELKKAIAEKKVTVIDVNGADSYKAGHVPSALDFDAVESKLATVLPKDKAALVVAYCGSPSCSAYTAAANAAKKLGYTNVKHLSAGISGWKAAKEDTEK
jgi:rhodanese-related sulfurtransferase